MGLSAGSVSLWLPPQGTPPKPYFAYVCPTLRRRVVSLSAKAKQLTSSESVDATRALPVSKHRVLPVSQVAGRQAPFGTTGYEEKNESSGGLIFQTICLRTGSFFKHAQTKKVDHFIRKNRFRISKGKGNEHSGSLLYPSGSMNQVK
ncbi:hypothetical protein NQ318_019914 [Aromia moschata]|uniref:Uncharacterized protein n=1 Tax=Aromia moschata TaxID=1265417 RepID=A0AAV8XJU6_9CUCU|nr:hypothetical protein NQ318_019914 [Aromia moschata]